MSVERAGGELRSASAKLEVASTISRKRLA
jgi:hypothetical protein